MRATAHAMDLTSLLVGVALGALAGAAGGAVWALLRVRREAEERLEGFRGQLDEARGEATRLRAELEAEQRAAEEKLATIATMERRLKETFEALSSEALKSNNQAFLALADAKFGQLQEGARTDLDARRKAIDELMKPVKESLTKVETTLGSVEQARRQAYGELSEQVKSLASAQVDLRSETSNLVQALRKPQVRGNWGEMQLRRVVELAGMLNYCDFHEQVTTDDGEGHRLRPDLVVHLPGGKSVVVDAKTPLEAYLDALEEKDDAVRETRMQDHARQVRDHMKALSQKSYWDRLDDSPEFVVMFLPGETFFSAALQHDPSLIEYGVDQRVIPASPTTLIALLRAVAYGWQQERIAESAREMHELGKELYDRLKVMTGHFQRVGTGLKGAVDAYNATLNSMEKRLFVTARRIEDLEITGDARLESPSPIEVDPRRLTAIGGSEAESPAAKSLEDGSLEDGPEALSADADTARSGAGAD